MVFTGYAPGIFMISNLNFEHCPDIFVQALVISLYLGRSRRLLGLSPDNLTPAEVLRHPGYYYPDFLHS